MEISAKKHLIGEIYGKQKLVENISGKRQLSGDISIGNTMIVDYEEFDGPYDVKPIIDSQTIMTKGKLMKENLTVLAIPYAEVTNNANGITVTIGE